MYIEILFSNVNALRNKSNFEKSFSLNKLFMKSISMHFIYVQTILIRMYELQVYENLLFQLGIGS